MTSLHGALIALLEGRMSGELASLVMRHGGEALCVPAVRETSRACDAEIHALIDGIHAGAIDLVICSTGVGVKTLVGEAARIGRERELLDALGRVALVCRGPKPSAALKQVGLRPAHTTVPPHTGVELWAVLEDMSMNDRGVALLNYGERNAALAEALTSSGARLVELCVYEWQLPDDLAPLQNLIESIICNRVDAVAFTSQAQLRHLLRVAADMQLADVLIDALNHETIVAAVGPTCAAALRQAGITPHVEPEHPKMGQMVAALAAYITREVEADRRPNLEPALVLA